MSAHQSKRFYLLVETDQLPICNQISGNGRHLSVDEILKRTEREIEVEPYKKPFPWLSILTLVAFVIGMIWIFTE